MSRLLQLASAYSLTDEHWRRQQQRCVANLPLRPTDLDGADVEDASQLVDHQRGQRLPAHVLCDDEQRRVQTRHLRRRQAEEAGDIGQKQMADALMRQGSGRKGGAEMITPHHTTTATSPPASGVSSPKCSQVFPSSYPAISALHHASSQAGSAASEPYLLQNGHDVTNRLDALVRHEHAAVVVLSQQPLLRATQPPASEAGAPPTQRSAAHRRHRQDAGDTRKRSSLAHQSLN